MKSLLPVIIFCASSGLGAADTTADGFIEGFPDVPMLDVIETVESDSVLFDTPSGSVAELTARTKSTALNAMKQYRESLTALGWTCNSPTIAMDCWREKNRLIFKSATGDPRAKTLILRLEPRR